MTSSEIQPFAFEKDSVSMWASSNPKANNWPVVYTINNASEIYVGESTNAEIRMRQHLGSAAKSALTHVNVIIDDSFNKSVCLDLESHLIRYFHADDKYIVLNGNGGITDADYFDRDKYRKVFDAIFDELLASGQLTRSVPELVNSDFFKYSPFKALTSDQAAAVEEILEVLLSAQRTDEIVIQGDPGTGKTIVAVYLMKLLRDIARSSQEDSLEADSMFSDFFQQGFREIAATMKIGLVVPQISLRETLRRVFKKTPGLDEQMVLEPFEVGKSDSHYDLLIVDEAHRLQQRANQPAAERNILYKDINRKLFGLDDPKFTQLDWIRAKSDSRILFLDKAQSVKPADLPAEIVDHLVSTARDNSSYFALSSQMRVAGGADYIDYISQILNGNYKGTKKTFGNYDVKIFKDFKLLHNEIQAKNNSTGLARIVSGFAWPWISRKGALFDFELDGVKLTWNRRAYDWINSKTSIVEVGSIHTIQGYDLNYAGVIIGNDISYDPTSKKLIFNRENYHDKKGKENNRVLGKTYTDEDLLSFVKNIYRVLMTRGVNGTYVYAVDKNLRDYLANYFDWA